MNVDLLVIFCTVMLSVITVTSGTNFNFHKESVVHLSCMAIEYVTGSVFKMSISP